MSYHQLLVSAIIIVAIAAAAEAAQVKNGHHALETRFFSTRLDHFTPTDARTVNMSYVQMTDYRRADGPLFIYVQEGDRSTTEFLQSGLMHDIAAEVGAVLVTADLRYFHSNLPTANVSVANLRHLTVEQIVQDHALLIQAVRADLQLAASARCILWGRGLGATLATWTRQKFPHLVHAVWSSSGRYETVVHTDRPYRHLAEQIGRVGGAECEANLARTFGAFEEAMVFGEVVELQTQLGLCSSPYYYYDEEVSGFFAGITQLIVDQINEKHVPAIVELCAALAVNSTEPEAPAYAPFAHWVRTVGYVNRTECLDVSYFSRYVDNQWLHWENVTYFSWADNIDMVFPHQSRPQMWLACTQLGGIITTVNSPVSTFGHQVGQDLLFNFCADCFGREYEFGELSEAVRRIEQTFGGVRPRVSRVLYTNGQLDAWQPFGVHLPYGVSAAEGESITISTHGASADLYSIGSDDTPQLASVKELIWQTVSEWVRL